MSWIDRFFALYEDGRKNHKAPESYIDYFKAREFVMQEREYAFREVWEIAEELGHQQEDGSIWLNMDELHKRIEKLYSLKDPQG